MSVVMVAIGFPLFAIGILWGVKSPVALSAKFGFAETLLGNASTKSSAFVAPAFRLLVTYLVVVKFETSINTLLYEVFPPV